MTAFIDEATLRMWRSPSGLRHVGAWFGQTICSAYPDRGWTMEGLTCLRSVGRMSRNANVNRMCKRCAAHYKDVRDD